MDPVTAHATRMTGTGDRTVLLAHGLGADQRQWDQLAALLAPDHQVITFDLAGSGRSDPALFSDQRHNSIDGFADDLAELCRALGIRGVTYVGHSLSGMAGALAASADPGLFSSLVLIGASACYIDDPETDYVGGFSAEQVAGLLDAIDTDFAAWATGFGPAAMANADRPGFAADFTRSLTSYRPEVARTVFRAAFTSDHRADMPLIPLPTLLVQTRQDLAVPLPAAEFLRDTIPGAQLEVLPVEGHFPHVVRPDLVEAAVRRGGAGQVP